MTCLICGGFKPEPGRTYGYPGALCHCASQRSESMEMIRLLHDILEELKDMNERVRCIRREL